MSNSLKTMFIFDISEETININGKKKVKLPPLQNWLSVPQADTNENVNLSEYKYEYDNLIRLKKLLNKSKQNLDYIYTSATFEKMYRKISNLYRSYDLLRGKDGFLVQNYNAEIVTNAWLKMYEMIVFIDDRLKKINKSKTKTFNTVHIAEAPGNFILAINHYIKTLYPHIEWNWLANSYRELYDSNSTHDFSKKNTSSGGYLNDVYGLMKNYKNKWMFGADGDGDITSVNNIISFNQQIKKDFKDKVDLLTSDVKYEPKDIDYNEEENYNIPVHLGHLLCALTMLKPGGTMILKEFTFFESMSVSLLYLMVNCFKRVLIVKPETSRDANSEVYIIGISYKDNLSELQINRLYDILNYIRYFNNKKGSPALFKKEDIPTEFINRLCELGSALSGMQSDAIDKNIELYDTYKNSGNEKLSKDLQVYNEKIALDWIKKTNIQSLEDNDKLIVHTNQRKNYNLKTKNNKKTDLLNSVNNEVDLFDQKDQHDQELEQEQEQEDGKQEDQGFTKVEHKSKKNNKLKFLKH